MNNQNTIMTRKRSALGQLNNDIPRKIKKQEKRGKENQTENIVAEPTKKSTTTLKKPPVVEEVFLEPCGDFQRVPDHVLEKIFQNLDRDSTLQLTMTCKRFNRVFSEHLLMSYFKLTLDFDTEELPTKDILTRRYQKVVFKNLSMPGNYERFDAMKSIFRHLGPSIRFLKLSLCSISDVWISRLLLQCPNLEVLVFKNCAISSSNLPLKETSLTKLKKFKISNTSCNNVARLFQNVTTLENIQIVSNHDLFLIEAALISSEAVEDMKAVIARQKNLKKLSITDIQFFTAPFINCQFQLEHLEISTIVIFTSQMVIVKDFLKMQRSIESCVFNVAECPSTSLGSSAYIEAMMYLLGLRTMKKIRLVLFTEEAMEAIYEENFFNPQITELEFLAHHKDHAYKRVVEAIAKKFVNLRKLRFAIDKIWLQPEKTSERTFEPLSTLKHLEELTLEHFESRLVGKIEMPQLKRFVLVNLKASKDYHWDNFFEKNPSIQEIYIWETASVSKHSLIRLVKSAVMNLGRLQQVRMCDKSFGQESFSEMCSFIETFASVSFKHFRVCSNYFYFLSFV